MRRSSICGCWRRSARRSEYSLEEIGGNYGLTRLVPLPPDVEGLLDPQRFNLILHPKSRGSAREWGLENYGRLIGLLPRERFKIFVSGTAAEGELLTPLLATHPEVTDLTGRLTLGQLMTFISKADGLVAASTGRFIWRRRWASMRWAFIRRSGRCIRAAGRRWGRRRGCL